MITINQLARSIARHLNVTDPTNLPIEATIDVLNAINSGLHLFYQNAPANLTRLTVSATFKAPTQINPLTFTGQYRNTVVGNPFDASWYGCGLITEGLNHINEIRGTNSLLDDWLSPTLTTVGTVLHDAYVLDVATERATSDVRLYIPGYPTPVVLYRDDDLMNRRRHWDGMLFPPILPRPMIYRIEPIDFASQGTNTALIRIFPAPQSDCIARFEAEINAASFTLADLAGGTNVPVADAWVGLLTPLCEAELTYSPAWRDPKTKEDIRKQALNVIETRIKALPMDLATPNNSVGTPQGF